MLQVRGQGYYVTGDRSGCVVNVVLQLRGQGYVVEVILQVKVRLCFQGHVVLSRSVSISNKITLSIVTDFRGVYLF